MSPSCVDCGRPATVSLGTTWFCQWCKWEVQAAILARRPDLRAPGVGTGRPTGTGDDPQGPPRLRCDKCHAEWHGAPLMVCPWCEEQLRHDAEIQRSMEWSRFEDHYSRLAEGDLSALGPAIHLAERLGLNRRLAVLLAGLEAA